MTSASDILLERVRAATAEEYTIEAEIGRGGMAAVFLARDIALERRVAIKVMLPDLTDVAGTQDRFVIEARTAAHLDHPGIVTVYSVKQRAGLLFIVMKYLEGRTLEELLRERRPHDPGGVTFVVRQVAEALQFAHSEGVVHRDVKPSNIIIDARGRPVVTDFGIAKVLSGRSITVAGSMLGTPAYMSPEQCRGLAATAASDQYALGVMTYEMLSGRLPFTGTIFELITAHSSESPRALREFVPTIDPALEETVMRMLAKNPADRWQSLGEVVQRLGGGSRRGREPSATATALARDEPTLAFGPAAVTVDIPSTSREAPAITEMPTPKPTPTPTPGLSITPQEPAVEIGRSLQLHASDSSGAPIAFGPIAWQSEDPTIATVGETGLLTGVSAGYAKITVTAGAALGRVGVTVNVPVAVPALESSRVAAPEPALVPVAAFAEQPPRPRTSRRSRGILFAGATIVVVVAALLYLAQGRRPPPVALQSKPAAGVSSGAAPDTAQVVARVPPPDTTVASTKVQPAPVQQQGRGAVQPRPDSSRAVAARGDSARTECPKLLERISLGEKLTGADSARFRRFCTR